MGLLSAPPAIHSPGRPMKPLPSPNMMPQPRNRNASDEAANTMKFLNRMFTVFFARQRPDSTMAKPRFMKNTRNAGDQHPDRVERDLGVVDGRRGGGSRVLRRGRTGHAEQQDDEKRAQAWPARRNTFGRSFMTLDSL